MGACMHASMDEWNGQCVDGWTDEWNGCMDGFMDARKREG